MKMYFGTINDVNRFKKSNLECKYKIEDFDIENAESDNLDLSENRVINNSLVKDVSHPPIGT